MLKLITDNFKENVIEDIFNDNIRVFLKYRSRINRNIKETALSEDNYKFFYFNNGITLICDKFSYEERRAPIVTLSNVQIVNGGQTVHALFDAYVENKDAVKNISVLIRIYETAGENLSQKIAEYTNSQNPVKNRDIRANDYIQVKLEKELLLKGYFYERKKRFYKDKPKDRRIDSEKAGQVLMAFYNDMPGDAKNKKSLVFEDKFEEIFNDNLTAEKVLLAYKLYEKIEKIKGKKNEKIITLRNEQDIDRESFILYASYYILYLIKKIAQSENIATDVGSYKVLWALYPKAVKLVRIFIKQQRKEIVNYSHSTFFKGNNLKKIIDNYFKKIVGIPGPS